MNGLKVFSLGIHAGNVPHFSPIIPRDFDQFSADSDGVDDRLPDGLTDESNDAWINRSLPYCTLLGVLWKMCHAWITHGIVSGLS